MKFNNKDIIFWSKTFYSFIIIILIINLFFIWLFKVSGHSMDDTLHNNQYILTNKIGNTNLPYIWRLKQIERGDIVVFNSHIPKQKLDFKDKLFWEKNLYIKRIIWLPGETVKIQNWKVYISKDQWKTYKELNEPYLNKENKWKTYVWSLWFIVNPNEAIIYNVPKEQYFVLGDNRLGSSDSRTCFQISCDNSKHTPFIKREDIIWTLFKK